MADIKVPTNFNIELEFEIPEFYRRMFAFLIDMLVLFIYLKIIEEVYQAISARSNNSHDSLINLSGVALLLMLPILVYHLVMEITMNGQSVGKKLMGLRVVNENGGRASISQFIIRWLIRDIWFLSMLGIASANRDATERSVGIFILLMVFLYFLVDVVLVATSRKSQRIGDILAHTILIRTNTTSSIEETVFQEVADNYVPSFPAIMKLSDKDINAIKSILETARKKGDFYMAENAANKIMQHLQIKTSLSPFDFLETLLKDYNYLSTK